jgi:hypothetical protein
MAISLPARVNHAGVLMVLVTGGRDFDDEPDYLLHSTLACVLDLCARAGLQMAVVQGGARGADAAARSWAMDNHIMFYNEPARWDDLSHPDAVIRTHPNGRQYDANAGPRRNQLMIDKHKPDLCIAAPGGAGTADMVKRCRAAGTPVYSLDGETHGGN